MVNYSGIDVLGGFNSEEIVVNQPFKGLLGKKKHMVVSYDRAPPKNG